jgi:putative ABC transport system permease protein
MSRRKRMMEDLDQDIRDYIERETQDNIERGMAPEEARYAALRKFGNVTRVREETWEVWSFVWLEQLRQDVRFGLRQLRRNPGFTFVAVLTLALGIGVNTTIFRAVSATLLRKPPVKDPDSLCAISSKNVIKGDDLVGVSAPDFESWQKQNDVFEDMAAVESGRSFTLTGKGEPESVEGDRVTPGYFRVVGVMPALGRAFLPSEGQAENSHVVILSDSLWHERFGADPNVIGNILEIEGEPYTIVGVMPARSDQAESGTELWTPLAFGARDLSSSARANHYLDLVLGRLKPGITVRQAQSEMSTIAQRLSTAYPQTNDGWGVTVLTLQEYNIRSADVRNGMMMLMTVVCLVLFLACANVAGLLLARGASRTHELAVRSAVGASRLRLLRQMLVESLLIGAAGGGAGLLISVWGIRLLAAAISFSGEGRQRVAGFGLDQPTLLFTLAVSLLATLVFGLLPALCVSGANPGDALSEGGRTGSPGSGRTRLRSMLAAGEIVLAVVLIAATGIITREVIREMTEPNGFNPRHLLVATLDVSRSCYKSLDARVTFFKQVTEKVRNLPGVEAGDMDSCVPVGCSYSTSFSIAGQPPLPPSKRPSADFFVVGPDYFRTMQIPLMKGRVFSGSDDAHAPVVAVVNQEFARRFFPKEDAIGKQIEVNDGNNKWSQIAGIVGNVNDYPGELAPSPQIYECYPQIRVNAFSSMALVVRSRAAPAAFAAMLRRAVWLVDKDEPVTLQTMQDLIGRNLAGDKLVTELMATFAGLALLLAAVGIYGVIAFSVAQRTREIGIRVALGAQRKDVLDLLLRQGAALAAVGCGVGVLLALPLPHVFSSLFSGFAPQGPLTAVAATIVVAMVSLSATYIPARRAAKVDPMVALRCE